MAKTFFNHMPVSALLLTVAILSAIGFSDTAGAGCGDPLMACALDSGSTLPVTEKDGGEPIAPDDTVWEKDGDETGKLVVANAFQLIPDRDIDLLAPASRWEMVQYMEADSIRKTRNVYSGLSWIEKMIPGYMRVHLTDVSNLQIKALHSSRLKNGNLVMTIYTVAGEADTADSTIKFYSLSEVAPDSIAMEELQTRRFFRLPDPKDFYNVPKGSSVTVKDLLEEMPFHTVAYDISESGDTLVGRLTVSNYLTLEQRDRVSPYITPELRWIWNGKEFKKESN